MRPESVEIWEKRIIDMKASGMKVAEWCEKNDVTPYTYYYWKRRLEALRADQHQSTDSVVFAELPVLRETERGTSASQLLVSWKDIQITISNTLQAGLAAELISQLQKRC